MLPSGRISPFFLPGMKGEGIAREAISVILPPRGLFLVQTGFHHADSAGEL